MRVVIVPFHHNLLGFSTGDLIEPRKLGSMTTSAKYFAARATLTHSQPGKRVATRYFMR